MWVCREQINVIIDEMKNAIVRLKNENLAGIDRVHDGILKEWGELGLSCLLEICKKAWSERHVCIRGDMIKYKNIKSISLLSVMGKI